MSWCSSSHSSQWKATFDGSCSRLLWKETHLTSCVDHSQEADSRRLHWCRTNTDWVHAPSAASHMGAFLHTHTLLACLTYQQGGVTFPWSSPVVLAPLCSAFLVIGLFCLWEWKAARLPIVPSTSPLIARYSNITSVVTQCTYSNTSPSPEYTSPCLSSMFFLTTF